MKTKKEKEDIAKMALYNLMENWDRIQIKVLQSKERRMTYKTLIEEVFIDPVTRISTISSVTAMKWRTDIAEKKWNFSTSWFYPKKRGDIVNVPEV